MQRIPPIKAVMTPFPHSVEIDQSIQKAREMMRGHGIRHLPVVDRGRLVAVVTDHEIGLALQHVNSVTGTEPSIREIGLRQSYVVRLDEPLDGVLFHMAEHHIDSALVARDGKLVGIFTFTDACRAFGQLLRTLFPSGGDDRVA